VSLGRLSPSVCPQTTPDMGLGWGGERAIDATSPELVETVLPSRRLPGMAGARVAFHYSMKNGSDNSAARESQRKIDSRIADDRCPATGFVGRISEWLIRQNGARPFAVASQIRLPPLRCFSAQLLRFRCSYSIVCFLLDLNHTQADTLATPL
jgi:hypothetical protein